MIRKSIIRISTIAAISCGLMASSLNIGIAGNQSTNASESTNSRKMIVCFKNNSDDMMVIKSGGKLTRKFSQLPLAVVEGSSTTISSLKSNSNVSCLEDDIKIKATAQLMDWGIPMVNAQQSWNLGLTGKGIKIAVIDTGIATHKDLVVKGGQSFLNYTASYEDDHGHGTHVAGIIGARNNDTGTVGVAPESDLYALKVLDSNGYGDLSGLLDAINWSITEKMDIINMSLGTSSYSSSMEVAVNLANSKGIHVIAAAGNSGTSSGNEEFEDTVDYPARFDSVIAVAAIDSGKNRPYFSSTGPDVEVAAPGVNILSTYLSNQYAYMSGTSMAAPYASGVMALLKQAYPSENNADLRKRLQETVVDLGKLKRDPLYGYGLIQAPTTLASPSPSPTPTATPTITPTASPTPTIQPTATPVPSPEIVAMISTNKSTYDRKEPIPIRVKASVASQPLLNAGVKIAVIAPNGATEYLYTTTYTKNGAALNYKTTRAHLTGTYLLQVEISYPNYKSGFSSTTFVLK